MSYSDAESPSNQAKNVHKTQKLFRIPDEAISRNPSQHKIEMLISSNKSSTIFRDISKQQIVVVENKTKQVVHSNNSQAQFLSISPFDSKILMANYNRAALIDLATKTQEIYDLPNPEQSRLAAECCLWLKENHLLFVSVSGVFSWVVGVNQQPKKIFDIPNANQFSFRGLSCNNSCQSVMVAMEKQSADEMGMKQLQPCSYYSIKSRGQLINHDCVTIFDALIEEECDLVFSLRSFPDHILAVLRSRTPDGKTIGQLNTQKEIKLTHENDKPIFAFKCFKRHLLYIVTKKGEVFVLDPLTLSSISSYFLINDQTIIHAYADTADEGFIAITSDYEIIKSLINPDYAEEILQKIIHDEKYLKRLLLAGNFKSAAAKILEPKLIQMLNDGQYEEAISFILDTPGQVLRCSKTMDLLAALPGNNRETLQRYVNKANKKGPLNESECMWLIREAKKQQSFHNVITKLLELGHFHCSEEIGDQLYLLSSNNEITNALSIYIRSKTHHKVIGCFCLLGNFDQMNEYKGRCLPNQKNYSQTISELSNFDQKMVECLLEHVLEQCKNNSQYFNQIFGAISKSTFLDALIPKLLAHSHKYSENSAEDEKMILRSLILINSLAAVQMISQGDSFKFLDSATIKEICADVQEKEPLIALLFETNHYEVKRILLNSNITPPFQLMLGVIEPRSAHEQVEILEVLLQSNDSNKINLANKIVTHLHESLPMPEITSIYTRSHCQSHLMSVLKSLAFSSTSNIIPTLYAELCLTNNHLPELEDLIRNQKNLNYNSLMQMMLHTTPFPTNYFIVLCDVHEQFEDMVKTLLQLGHEAHLTTFVQRISPHRLPQVVSICLGQGINDEKVNNLISGTEPKFSLVNLFKALENANKLELIRPTLETRLNQNSTDPEVYTTLAMFNVRNNLSPESFITTNKLYDTKVVGEYCLKYNNRLACLAYIAGEMDAEIMHSCEKYQHYDLLCDYCLQHKNRDFWRKVLSLYFDDSENLASQEIFLKQLTKSAINCQNMQSLNILISCIVEISNDELLHAILKSLIVDSQNSIISSSPDYQTMFLKLAAKYEPQNVMNCLKKLKGYNVDAVYADLKTNKLHEEAFEMLRLNQRSYDAMQILLKDIKDLDRALVFASQINDLEAISQLAVEFLQHDTHYSQALKLFVESKNFSKSNLIIESGLRLQAYDDLFKYLLEARQLLSESLIDTNIVVVMAFLGNETDIKSFLAEPNKCNSTEAGDICLENGLLNAAQILYQQSSNFAKLSLVLIERGHFQKAIEFAEKANDNGIWFKIAISCLAQGEYQSAMYATGKVLKANYNVNEIVSIFESYGKFDMLCSCLEDATNYSQSQSNIYHHFVITAAKYKSELLEQAIMMHHLRLDNKTEITRALMSTGNYREASLLDELSQNFDFAVERMLDYPAQAWKHSKLLQLVSKVSQVSTLKDVMNFYIMYQPELLPEVYQAMLVKLDHSTLLSILGDNKYLILETLETKYTNINDRDVNNSLITIYAEADEREKLKKLLMTNDNYSPHLIPASWGGQFADIQVITLRQAKKFREAFSVSKQNNVLGDILNIMHECRDQSLINDIIDWLVLLDDKSHFLAALALSFDCFGIGQAWKIAYTHDCESLVTPFAIAKSISLDDKLQNLESKSSNSNNGPKSYNFSKSTRTSPFTLSFK